MTKIPFELLPTRLVRLKGAGILTFEDLKKVPEQEILNIPGIGRKTLLRLKNILDWECNQPDPFAAANMFTERPKPLNERYLIALKMRNEGKTYREIGDKLSVSSSRARQIVMGAIRKLRYHERYTKEYATKG